MKAVVQRVRRAGVQIQSQEVSQIGEGLVILLGIGHGDRLIDAQSLAEKIQSLRIFSDDMGKMNRSIRDVDGSILVVSQFTLLANTARGRRPSFELAAPPDMANALYEGFIQHLRSMGLTVETGTFGASMVLSLENDGPVTFVLDTGEQNRVIKH